jgi:hypothetical protein
LGKSKIFNLFWCTSDDCLASFIPAASKVQHMSDGGQLTIRVVRLNKNYGDVNASKLFCSFGIFGRKIDQ